MNLISALSALLPESITAVVMAQLACSALCLLLIWTRPKDSTG
ncbi:hypothetical protein [Thalassolituus marinus]|nr:hypothetical protein [Thalassolituus marinus]